MHQTFFHLQKPLSSGDTVHDFGIGGRWFDPPGLNPRPPAHKADALITRQPRRSRILCRVMTVELQESMDRCTGQHDVSEIMLNRRSRLLTLNQSFSFPVSIAKILVWEIIHQLGFNSISTSYLHCSLHRSEILENKHSPTNDINFLCSRLFEIIVAK